MFFFEPMGTQAGDHVELYNFSYSSAPISIIPLKLWNICLGHPIQDYFILKTYYNLSYSSPPTSIFPLKLWNTVWDTESRITLFENLYLFNLLKGVNLHPFIFSGLEKIKRGKKTQK